MEIENQANLPFRYILIAEIYFSKKNDQFHCEVLQDQNHEVLVITALKRILNFVYDQDQKCFANIRL